MLPDKILSKSLFVFLLCLILTACGSTQTTTRVVQPVENSPEPEVVMPTEQTSLAYIASLLEQQPLNRDVIFPAVKQLVIEGQYDYARALLFTFAPYAQQEDLPLFQSLLAISSQPESDVINHSWLQYKFDEDALEKKRLQRLVSLQLKTGNDIAAMLTQLALTPDDIQLHLLLTEKLARMPTGELRDLESQYPVLRPHAALVSIQREYGNQPEQLTAAVQQFQQVYYAHPLSQNLPNGLQQAMSFQGASKQDVVVMLPLSGRFETTGNAIKQGILAAYFAQNAAQEQVSVRFLDTVALAKTELLQQASNADWVIGPLLKENIDAVVPFLPLSVKRLALNRVDADVRGELALTLGDTQTAYFGLAPEDEAIQLAHHVFKQGYRHPIVVASELGVGQRMLQAFTQTWKTLSPLTTDDRNMATFDTVEFESIDNLGEALATALGVSQSDENIRQINRMTNRILYDQNRSRQDIDAIVVFASPEQLSLINPMVEASISPFRAQTVPVYASSRSIERTDAPNQLRDLENVRFLDAPFVLMPERWTTESNQVSALWPEQRASFSRLFAFGFDALTMLSELPVLASLPGYRFEGMSGSMKMNEYAEIERLLPMAQIRQQQVTQME